MSQVIANDQVILVTEDDQETGVMDKVEAHRGAGSLHRAISVFLLRTGATGVPELLIQQRSNKKIVGAGQWANTCCGNVWPGESYEDCAYRRLAAEHGITQTDLRQSGGLRDVSTFRYQVQCNEEFSENEIDHVFVGTFAGNTQPNPDEVAETDWVTFETAIKLDKSKDWAPWFVLMMKEDELVQTITQYIKGL